MSKRIYARGLLRAACLLPLAAPFAAQASLLGTRPGEWKEAVTRTVTLPGQHAGKAQTRVKYECQKTSGSVKAMLHSLGKYGCKVKALHQSARMADFTLACASPDKSNALQHIHIRMQALTVTHVAATMRKSFPGGKMVRAKSDSHWVSDTCKPQ